MNPSLQRIKYNDAVIVVAAAAVAAVISSFLFHKP